MFRTTLCLALALAGSSAVAVAAPRPAPDALCPDQDNNIQVSANIMRRGVPNPLENSGDAVTVRPGERIEIVAACITHRDADSHRVRMCLTDPAARRRCWTFRRLSGDEWPRPISIKVRMKGTWELSARSGTALIEDTFTVSDD